MFLEPENIAWAGTANPPTGEGGCAFGPTNFICTNLPNIAPFAGSFTPGVEVYAIDVTTLGGGQVVILTDGTAADSALTAFLSRYYTASETSAPIWDAGVVKFQKNSDGSYEIASSADPNAAGPRCEFKEFQRASHSGTLYNAGTAYTYTATKQ